MAKVNGMTHWHKDHQGNNPEERMLKVWARAFNDLSTSIGTSVKIYGDSAITGFSRVDRL